MTVQRIPEMTIEIEKARSLALCLSSGGDSPVSPEVGSIRGSVVCVSVTVKLLVVAADRCTRSSAHQDNAASCDCRRPVHRPFHEGATPGRLAHHRQGATTSIRAGHHI